MTTKRALLPLAAPAPLGLLAACSDDSDTPLVQVAPASLTIAPVAAPEGAAGELSELRFRVTLTGPQPEPVIVRYQTSAGTATAGEDYLESAGEVEIPPGVLEAYIAVELIGDGEEEPAETFTLDFSTSDNALPTAAVTTGTLANDDTASGFR